MRALSAPQTLVLDVKRPQLLFAVTLTPAGIVAIGALTAGILLATTVLVRTAIRESKAGNRLGAGDPASARPGAAL